MNLELVEKLRELVTLVQENKVVNAEERIDYVPVGELDFEPRNYVVKFTIVDPKTKLPVTVTIETPVEKKND